MEKKYAITYDFGTGSLKAALIDDHQNVLSWGSIPYTMYYPQPGFAVQKVDDYWNVFCEITKKMIAEAGIDKEEIKGITISHTSCTIIFIDEDGNALDDCVTWIDNRAVEQADYLNKARGYEWQQGKRIPAKLRWFVENKPELLAKAKYCTGVPGYFTYRMGREIGWEFTDFANAMDMMDPETMNFDPEVFDLIGIREDLFAKRIYLSHEKICDMTMPDAEEAGFALGTPIFGGTTDNANGQLGAGAIDEDDVHIYFGSSGWVSTTVKMPSEGANVIYSAVPGMGYDYYCTDSVGTSVDYWIGKLYAAEKEAFKDDPGKLYALVEKEVQETEDLVLDTIYMPYQYGEEEPVMDSSVRGTLLNIKPDTSRGHIMRAVYEGTAFNYRWIKEKLQASNHWNNVNEVVAIGGGTQSDTHMQIIADVMDEKIVRLKEPRVAGNIGLTACIDIGLGIAKDYSVLKEYAKPEKVFLPRPEKQERYEKLLVFFKKAYYDYKELYEQMNGEEE